MAHRVQHIAITFDDGSVGVMQFILDPRLPPDTDIPGMREDGLRVPTREAVEHEIAKSVWIAKPVSWRFLDAEHIPADRTYRNAWHDPDKRGALQHDMEKARDIHREHLRLDRAPLLAELDALYAQAEEAGDTKAKKDIAQHKQKLRDVTGHPKIDAASTPDELKALSIETLT